MFRVNFLWRDPQGRRLGRRRRRPCGQARQNYFVGHYRYMCELQSIVSLSLAWCNHTTYWWGKLQVVQYWREERWGMLSTKSNHSRLICYIRALNFKSWWWYVYVFFQPIDCEALQPSQSSLIQAGDRRPGLTGQQGLLWTGSGGITSQPKRRISKYLEDWNWPGSCVRWGQKSHSKGSAGWPGCSEACFCALLRNRPKFEDVAFRQSLDLDHQILHRGIHK